MTEALDRRSVQGQLSDLLLAFAGRVDDDVLADARELLALTEFDRALGLLASTVVAGHIPVSAVERDRIVALGEAVLLGSVPSDAFRVDSAAPPVPHRFTAGTDVEDPRDGVADAIARTLEVVPDVRRVSATWRVTPAGSTPGPVPWRVVLVEAGRGCHPTAVAYRLERALWVAGLLASVEVLPEGTEPGAYHRAALAAARELPLDARVDIPPMPEVSAEPTEPDVPVAGHRHRAPEAPSEVAEPLSAEDGSEELNDRERDLLRQLHAELGKREGQPPDQDTRRWGLDEPDGAARPGGWPSTGAGDEGDGLHNGWAGY